MEEGNGWMEQRWHCGGQMDGSVDGQMDYDDV